MQGRLILAALALLCGATASQAWQLQVTRQDGVDLPGMDLPAQAAPARSIEECVARCVGSAACTAYTWDSGNGMCYPRARPAPARPAPGRVSGMVLGRGEIGGGLGVGTPNACSVGGEGKCPGCSVSCAAEQRPVCTAPIEGVAAQCQRDAWCRCAPR